MSACVSAYVIKRARTCLRVPIFSNDPCIGLGYV